MFNLFFVKHTLTWQPNQPLLQKNITGSNILGTDTK